MLAQSDPAAWVIVCVLAATLFMFLFLAIILVIKLMRITKEVDKIIEKSQSVANKADEIAENVRNMTATGGLVKNVLGFFLENKLKRKK